MKWTLNCLIYKNMWINGGVVKKVIYVMIPFVLMGVFFAILYYRRAITIEGGYGFQQDYTNKFMLFFIFFFVYFLSGVFTICMENKIDDIGRLIPQNKYNEYIKYNKLAKKYFSIIAAAIALIGVIFISGANNELTWYRRLNGLELGYYSFLIVYVWYMSACLFLSIIIDSVTLIKYLQFPASAFDFFHIDKHCGLKRTFNIIIANMGFGLYYLIMVAIIIFSDYKANQSIPELKLLAYEWRYQIIFITVFISVVYYTIVLLTYISLRELLIRVIISEAKKYTIFSEEGKFLRSINISILSVNNISVFLLSVLFPGIAAFIQIFSAIR